MSGYEAVVFDAYDVLIPDHDRLWRQAHGIAQDGGYAELSRQLDLGQLGYHDFIDGLASLSGQQADEVLAEIRTFAAPDPAIVSIVQRTHQIVATGLLSNAHSSELRPILEGNGLYCAFDEIVISSEFGARKPDPAIFEHMLAKLACTPAETIFVDDSARNVETARSLGMQAILFTGAKALRAELNCYLPLQQRVDAVA